MDVGQIKSGIYDYEHRFKHHVSDRTHRICIHNSRAEGSAADYEKGVVHGQRYWRMTGEPYPEVLLLLRASFLSCCLLI